MNISAEIENVIKENNGSMRDTINTLLAKNHRLEIELENAYKTIADYQMQVPMNSFEGDDSELMGGNQ